MIPFCWIVLYKYALYPHEGHFLWIAGMVFALFSDSLFSNRGVPAGFRTAALEDPGAAR